MGNLIPRSDAAKHRDRIEAYYKHVHGLRAAGNLSSVFGQPFIYRPDGTGLNDLATQFLVWNMRRSPPVSSFSLNDKLHALLGLLHPRDVPCELPDLGDSAIVDVPVDELLNSLLADVPHQWESPLMQAKFDKPSSMFDQAVDNACIGDIPWKVIKADEAVRREHGWDAKDLDGRPWIFVDGRPLYIKTERMGVVARTVMRNAKLETTPLYEGDPRHPDSVQSGVFHAI